MNQQRKEKLKNHFREMTNREPTLKEEGNMITDVGLCVKMLMEEMENVQDRLNKLDKKSP